MEQCFIRVVGAMTPDHLPTSSTLPTTTSLQLHLQIFSIISVTFCLARRGFLLLVNFTVLACLSVSEPNVSRCRNGFMSLYGVKDNF